MLIEFPSIVEAVTCAVAVQSGIAQHEAETPENQRISFRVGINVGDVIVEEGDIYGDGVNIAARLEGIAEPGSIYISGTVFDQVRDKLAIAFEDMGEQQVKNIARPVHIYRIADGAAARAAAPISPQAANPLDAPRLSIVVLPFVNLSNDPQQEYFTNGITDDLTTDLSRIADSFVIARTTAFTYKGKPVDVKQIARELGVRCVLEGSVRRLGRRVQVNVQLIDGGNGGHVWADRFDTDRRDLAEAQSEITGRLARTLGLELVRDAGRRIEEQRATDPNAADLVLQGRGFASRVWSPDNRQNAMNAFERALAVDPRSLDARIGIANALTNGSHSNGPDTPQDGARAELLLREVMARDPTRSETYRTLGNLRTAQARWDEAKSALRTALSLDPNNAGAMRNLGQLLQATGQSEAGIPYIEKALRLSPHDPGVAFGYLNLGGAYLFLGRKDEAMDLFRKAAATSRRIYFIHLVLAGALGLRGEFAEARAEIAEAQKLNPDITSVARWREDLRARGLAHPEWLAQMDRTVLEGLRRAGLPEE